MNPSTHKEKRISWRNIIRYMVALLGLCALIVLVVYRSRTQQPWEGFEKPDDIKVARELLAEKFTGPRYFHFEETTDNLLPPYISVSEARRQIRRVVKARQLPPAAEEKLERLIDILAEQPTSRIAGGSRVNTLQLNLALDSAK